MGPLHWGIVGCGAISKDFAACLLEQPRKDHQLTACAARDAKKAKEFAEEFGFERSHGSYIDLAKDPDVDVVYVGTINANHYAVCKLLLENDKHVLCEKPLVLLPEHARELVELSRQRKKFFQEAVYSRFFPVYDELRNRLKAGTIGDIKLISAHFGIKGDANASKNRIIHRKLGGGSIMDVGGYCIQLILAVYGPEMPATIKACGIKNSDGIDTSVQATMQWKDGRMAQLTTTFMQSLEAGAYIFGDKGHIQILDPIAAPSTLIVRLIKIREKDEIEEKFEVPLPEVKHETKYPKGPGLTYDILEVHRCLKAGWLESPHMTQEESLIMADIRERILQEIGISYRDLYAGEGASTTHIQ